MALYVVAVAACEASRRGVDLEPKSRTATHAPEREGFLRRVGVEGVRLLARAEFQLEGWREQRAGLWGRSLSHVGGASETLRLYVFLINSLFHAPVLSSSSSDRLISLSASLLPPHLLLLPHVHAHTNTRRTHTHKRTSSRPHSRLPFPAL